MDGWMDTFFSPRLSLSPLLLSLSVRAMRYPKEERTVLHDPVKVDIPEEHTLHTHAYIHIKRKNHPLTNKQTHLSDKSPVFRYLLPLYRAAVCLFVCALPYSTLPLHIIVTLISLCYAAKPLPVPNPNKDHWSKAQNLIHPTSFPIWPEIYTLFFVFPLEEYRRMAKKERKGREREGREGFMSVRIRMGMVENGEFERVGWLVGWLGLDRAYIHKDLTELN